MYSYYLVSIEKYINRKILFYFIVVVGVVVFFCFICFFIVLLCKWNMREKKVGFNEKIIVVSRLLWLIVFFFVCYWDEIMVVICMCKWWY